MTNKLKLYKYTTNVGYLKKSYSKQLIHLSPLVELNDPFEGYSIIKHFSPDFVLENPDIYKNMLRIFKEDRPSFTESDFINLLQSDDFKKELEEHSNIKKLLFPKHGITCFSSDPVNLPMWAYYANNHRGYCVEIEMDIDYIQAKTQILPSEAKRMANDIQNNDFVLSFFIGENEFVFSKVKYSDQLPIIQYDELSRCKSKYEQIDYIVKNSVGVKYKQWSHENEYRLIANSNSKDSGLLSLSNYAPFLTFTGVIIGAKMEQKYIKKIQELQKKCDFFIKRARLSDNAYKLEVM
ncbi:DUF2971 domain-containing protein [Legionella pneumophila]|uniref:DUF2971 domain-containing protein n=1 Tax=Legionella pneumophila TaxID=446 RepID=UPI0010222F6D|nr:DUF2971 domain-containing protein [Legionella pneumophila]RYW83732.1 DUF2971 domain-containing protein [Legionella pneumophila]HCD9498754.1 DUF2971 domain-containing protein [Legionella pneumophila]